MRWRLHKTQYSSRPLCWGSVQTCPGWCWKGTHRQVVNKGAALLEKSSISSEEPSLHLYHPVKIHTDQGYLCIIYSMYCYIYIFFIFQIRFYFIFQLVASNSSIAKSWIDSQKTHKHRQNVYPEVASDKVCHECKCKVKKCALLTTRGN